MHAQIGRRRALQQPELTREYPRDDHEGNDNKQPFNNNHIEILPQTEALEDGVLAARRVFNFSLRFFKSGRLPTDAVMLLLLAILLFMGSYNGFPIDRLLGFAV
jgi:hypothetical protein